MISYNALLPSSFFRQQSAKILLLKALALANEQRFSHDRKGGVVSGGLKPSPFKHSPWAGSGDAADSTSNRAATVSACLET